VNTHIKKWTHIKKVKTHIKKVNTQMKKSEHTQTKKNTQIKKWNCARAWRHTYEPLSYI
jgi:septal ring factor EnvC (AmiA/AmiB activator)